MGLGRRLYDLLRANVNHYLRREPGPERPRSHEPPFGDDHEPWSGAAGGGPFGVPPTGVSARRQELERRYRALELTWGDGPEAIRQAHRRLMRRFHPDRYARDAQRQADATRLVQELTAARDVLLAAIERGEIVPRPGSGTRR